MGRRKGLHQMKELVKWNEECPQTKTNKLYIWLCSLYIQNFSFISVARFWYLFASQIIKELSVDR